MHLIVNETGIATRESIGDIRNNVDNKMQEMCLAMEQDFHMFLKGGTQIEQVWQTNFLKDPFLWLWAGGKVIARLKG